MYNNKFLNTFLILLAMIVVGTVIYVMPSSLAQEPEPEEHQIFIPGFIVNQQGCAENERLWPPTDYCSIMGCDHPSTINFPLCIYDYQSVDYYGFNLTSDDLRDLIVSWSPKTSGEWIVYNNTAGECLFTNKAFNIEPILKTYPELADYQVSDDYFVIPAEFSLAKGKIEYCLFAGHISLSEQQLKDNGLNMFVWIKAGDK